MIFNAAGRVSYFQQLILLKGGSFQLLKLLLKIVSLLLAKNGGMSFQIMMQAIVLVDYLIIQQDSFLFHRFKSIDELVVEAFLVLKLMGKDLVLSGQEQVLFSQNFNLFQQLQIVFSVYQHSSIIQIYDFYNSCKYVIFNLRRGFQFRSYCHTRQLFLDEFNSKFINIQQLVVPIVSLIPDAIQLQSYLLGQQNQQQMIASHKLRTHFPPSNHPILKKETSAYKDQNNYSFSSKPTLRQYQSSQKTSTHKISTHKMKDKPTSSFNNTKDHSLALISKEENIKSIDQRIQAIMKKHSAQKDLHEGRAAAKQSIQSFHTTKQDKAIFEKSKLDYEVARPDSKKYNQIPQCRQSQTNNKRNYASANKQVKYSTSKDINSDDLDQKIKLLNERIIKAEQQKKRLNIKFTPFHWQTNTTSQSKIAKQQIEKTRKFSNLQSTIQILQHIKVQTLETKVQPLGRIKRQKSTNQVKTRCKEKIGTQQLKLSEGGQLKSSEKAQRSKQSMDQFLEAIVQQIKWDQAFRNIKIWFTFCNEKAKWDRLKQKLALKARQFNLKELKETFQSSIEQHNPFFKWDTINFEQGLQKLIQAYTISDKHWKTAISKKWGRLALQGAGMKRKIQYDSKSEVIAEQDLVRFINLQKDAFFRNRDLYLIFKRLCGGNSRLTYQKLMEGITREQQ